MEVFQTMSTYKTRVPAVSADHGMPEQCPHRLPVAQRAWDPSGYFLQLVKPPEKEGLP